MSQVTNELLYEVLKSLQGDISILKESVRRIDARIASMDHHLAGFYSEQRWQNDEIDNLRGRVEAIEDQDHDPGK